VGDKAPSITGEEWYLLGGVESSSKMLSSLGKHRLDCGKQGSEVNLGNSS
jgi:hypothetical protein